MRDLGVVYVCRFAEGDAPVRRFLETLRDHPAGIAHDFHVIFKGFPDRSSLERGQSLFADFSIQPIVLDDRGYDVGSYVKAAAVVSNSRLIFLNTFSQILAPDWLRKFSAALDQPRVGIVGATGSWQARTAGYEARALFVIRNVWRYFSAASRNHPTISSSIPARRKTPRDVMQVAFAPVAYLYHLQHYARFPNPHIRTNAFMMERDLLLSLRIPSFAEKEDAYRFESGRSSLTRQIIAKGLRPVVVDCNGDVFDVGDWDKSSTFWTKRQDKLLVADNRTRDYAEGTHEFQTLLKNFAWREPRYWLGV